MLDNSPVCIVPPTISFAPNQDNSNTDVYIVNCIAGPLNATIFSAVLKYLYTSLFTFSNFSSSCFSLLYAFTTLIAFKFSPTTLFKLSYFLNTFSKFGCAFFIININTTASIGMVITNIHASLLFMLNAIASEKKNINGDLTKILIII